MLTSVIGVLADLGYPGWDQAVITGRRKPRGKDLTAAQRAANRVQAQLRCVGERGNARLKYRKVLAAELRCRPEQCTAMVKAVLALHYMEHDPFAVVRAARRNRSLPARNNGTRAAAVSGKRSNIPRNQHREPRPDLSNQPPPCGNSG